MIFSMSQKMIADTATGLAKPAQGTPNIQFDLASVFMLTIL